VAYRLNEVGYAVVLIDYKEGRVPDLGTMPRILEAVAALSDTEVSCSVRSAIELLLERADIDGDRIATLGFCIGGTFSFLAGCQVEGLAASAVYYGTLSYPATTDRKPLSPISAAGDLKVPLIGHFGELDADSGDCGHGFRLNATMQSDRRRPPVPTKAAGSRCRHLEWGQIFLVASSLARCLH
jgi:dienelactone hydrolase